MAAACPRGPPAARVSDLRAIAEAARDWTAGNTIPWWSTENLGSCQPPDEDAAHIAAWSPERALAALAVVEAADAFIRTSTIPNRMTLRDALRRWDALP